MCGKLIAAFVSALRWRYRLMGGITSSTTHVSGKHSASEKHMFNAQQNRPGKSLRLRGAQATPERGFLAHLPIGVINARELSGHVLRPLV
jgi:hypothetical protein